MESVFSSLKTDILSPHLNTRTGQNKMRTVAKHLALMAASLAFLSTTDAAPVNPTDEAAIKALEQGFVAAFSARDVPKIMSFFAPGNELVVFDVMTPREFAGADAYRKDWEGFVKMTRLPFNVELQDFQMTTDGTLGFGHFVHHVTGQLNDGTTLDMTTRVTHDYKKIGGRWYIVHEHVSVPINWATKQPDWDSKR
jgi:ketosteroid isomerase-like protein